MRTVVLDIETVGAIPPADNAPWPRLAQASIWHARCAAEVKAATKAAVERLDDDTLSRVATAMKAEAESAAEYAAAEDAIKRDDKSALDAAAGRIVCICMLIDDGRELREISFCHQDESWLLREFWREIRPGDVIVGHNVLEFDLVFIRQRCWILGIHPSRVIDCRRFYTREVIDTMQLWTNWGAKRGGTLDALGTALCGAGKTGHGSDVATWWAAGELEKIARYCMDDVRLTYRVYCKLQYREPTAGLAQLSSAAGGEAA